MSKQLEWDAYRYVLDDPTLDRSAFEARMLDDVDLALAVADAWSGIDRLRAASFIVCPTPPARPLAPVATERQSRNARSGWQLSSLAALATALLLAVGLVNYRIHVAPSRAAHASVAKLNLAESWLAMRQTELVDMSTNLVDVSSNFENTKDENAQGEPDGFAAADSSSDDDWLMNAAREFYSQGGASS